MPADARVSFGKRGEDLACCELERRGYRILERRYRTRAGEIDIVASDGDAIVFVEVKARSSDRFGSALEAVTRWKQRRICHMAVDYLARRRPSTRPCRFDVVAVGPDAAGTLVVQVIQGAFGA